MLYAKNIVKHDDPVTKMKKYAKRNRNLFNPSQLIVLDKVIEMPENDILLIQGPVSNKFDIHYFSLELEKLTRLQESFRCS